MYMTLLDHMKLEKSEDYLFNPETRQADLNYKHQTCHLIDFDTE